ncbi:hypothetical protein [Salisediminibacterium beveridgei]|nr:hypothetical protein [Salisediminibacterium beveridgei]
MKIVIREASRYAEKTKIFEVNLVMNEPKEVYAMQCHRENDQHALIVAELIIFMQISQRIAKY